MTVDHPNIVWSPGLCPVPDYNMIPAKTGDSFIYPDLGTASVVHIGWTGRGLKRSFPNQSCSLLFSSFLVCSTISTISTYLHAVDIYTYLHNGMCPQLPVGAWAACSWRGSSGVQLPSSASHAASAGWSLWSALEWLNYSSKYFFGGGFVSTQKIIVQIPQPLPVQLTKK